MAWFMVSVGGSTLPVSATFAGTGRTHPGIGAGELLLQNVGTES